MTANQMADMFLTEIDSRQIQDTMGFEDEEISQFLNNAVYMLLKQMIREGLETTEYNRSFTDALKKDSHEGTVSTTVLSGNSAITHINGLLWTWPEDIWMCLKEYITTESNPLCLDSIPKDGVEVPVKPISEDYYLSNRLNKNRKPYFDGVNGLVWRLGYNIAEPPTQPPLGFVNPKRVELITDGTFEINTYHVRYLKKPVDIVVTLNSGGTQVNSEIYEQFHKDIVFKATELALENSQNRRFQTTKILNKEQSL